MKRPGCLLVVLAMLSACGAEEPTTAEPTKHKRPQPVALELVDGRPAPEVLAASQVLWRDNGEEPQTLDPHLAEGVPASNILRDLFEGLTAEAPDGRIVPGVAARWNKVGRRGDRPSRPVT